MSAQQDKLTVFQFQAACEWPIYLAVRLSEFESSLIGFLTDMGFDLVPGLDESALEKRLQTHQHGRLLQLELASAKVAQQIRSTQETDKYGQESLTPAQGYKIYRYKGRSLMIVSFGAETWRAGVFRDFGHEPTTINNDRVIINRYLSWALSSFGVVGFFAKLEGAQTVLMKPLECEGHAVFWDWSEQRLISGASVQPLKPEHIFARRVLQIRNRESRMSGEELLTSLSAHSTYLSYEGLSVNVRQSLQAIARAIEGRHLPIIKPVSPDSGHGL
jgi:hypothetical protein